MIIAVQHRDAASLMRKIFIAMTCAILAFLLCQTANAVEVFNNINSVNDLPGKPFEHWLRGQMERYKVPGISIVVVRDYRIEWVFSQGVVDVLSETPVTDTTLFQAGSISKPVTATAVMRAVQDGKLSLDEDINNILTSWKVPDNEFTQTEFITLRDLLSHSAGINNSGYLGYAAGDKLPTLLQVLNGEAPANSKPVTVITEPGQSFLYSGGGYVIIQQALIDAFHKPFAVLMDRLVLQPLAMTHSTFAQPLPEEDREDIAKPYRPTYESVPGGPHTYVEEAAAGLWTTPFDLAKFMISIQESLRGDPDQIIKPEYAKLMMQPEIDHMGLGFYVNVDKYGTPVHRGRYFAHPGQNEGYQNYMIGSIHDGYGAIIMTNASPDGHLLMTHQISDNWDFMNAVIKKIADMEEWD
jgi:CubicO group peptidase (beta-lactamase class C family)